MLEQDELELEKLLINYSNCIYDKRLCFPMLITIIVSLLLIYIAPQEALAQSSTSEQRIDNYLTFEDKKFGITIQYPSDWELDAEDSLPEHSLTKVMGFYSPKESDTDSFQESLVIKTERLPTSLALNKAAEKLLSNDARSLPKFDLISSKPTVIKGSPAYSLIYTYKDSDFGKIREMDLLVEKSNMMYVLEYNAKPANFDNYFPTIQKMINTFKTNNSSTAIQITEKQPGNDSVFFIGIFFLLIIISVIIVLIRRLIGNRRYKERRYFSDSVKENILRKQNHRCASCNRVLNVVDWDHKDGDRSNNRESNCQALCPNCHAIKTRTEKR
jgi:hypothetical protein